MCVKWMKSAFVFLNSLRSVRDIENTISTGSYDEFW